MPHLSMNSLPRISMAMRCPSKNTGEFARYEKTVTYFSFSVDIVLTTDLSAYCIVMT